MPCADLVMETAHRPWEQAVKLTLREFVLLRIADDHQQASATIEFSWDHAGTMKTALDHRSTLGTLTVLVEAHEPSDDRCNDCGQEWPCRTLRTIATTWREHEDFDEVWLDEA